LQVEPLQAYSRSEIASLRDCLPIHRNSTWKICKEICGESRLCAWLQENDWNIIGEKWTDTKFNSIHMDAV